MGWEFLKWLEGGVGLAAYQFQGPELADGHLCVVAQAV